MKRFQFRSTRTRGIFVLVALLICANVFVWLGVIDQALAKHLTVTFLNVGQGDAIFIETQDGKQILVDGGNGRAVLRELGSQMSFFDRTIDVVISTHPDIDHIGGLPEVFERYRVGMYITSGTEGSSGVFHELTDAVKEEGLSVLEGENDMYLQLNKDTALHILFPDREVKNFESNAGSLITKLTYGDTAFLFPGDTPAGIEAHVVGLYGEALESDVLKLSHHGSNTSSSELFLGFVNPLYAVISSGCDNPYGHPHEEVLARLERFDIEHVSTCEYGSITFISDGRTVQRK